MKKALIWVFVFLVGMSIRTEAKDDFQYWSQYNVHVIDREKWDFTVYADARFINDVGEGGLWFVSPRFKYHLLKNLDVAANYTYIENRVSVNGGTEFKYQHRAEAEIIPKWVVGDWLKIDIRNRAEFRWIEDAGSDNTRLRSRLAFTFPIKDNNVLSALYVNTEFFYDLNANDYTENRTVPLGLKFKIDAKKSFDIFYMIQHKNGTKDWYANQIFGTVFNYKF